MTAPDHPAGSAHSAFAGLLFDFAGFLTSHDRRWIFSSRDEATPGVEAVEQFAAKRGLLLDEADVKGWSSALSAAPVSPEPAKCDQPLTELFDELRNIPDNAWNPTDDDIRAGVRAFQSGHNGSDDLSDWRAFYREVHKRASAPAPHPAEAVSDEAIIKLAEQHFRSYAYEAKTVFLEFAEDLLQLAATLTPPSDAAIKEAISNATGFDWKQGELQPMNAHDLLNIARAILALAGTQTAAEPSAFELHARQYCEDIDRRLFDKMVSGLREAKRFIEKSADESWVWLDELVSHAEHFQATQAAAVEPAAQSESREVTAEEMRTAYKKAFERTPASDVWVSLALLTDALNAVREHGESTAALAAQPPAPQAEPGNAKYKTLVEAGMPPSEAYRLATMMAAEPVAPAKTTLAWNPDFLTPAEAYEQGRFDEQAAQGPVPYPDDAPKVAEPVEGAEPIRVKFDDNFLVEWSESIPDGEYVLFRHPAPASAQAGAVPEDTKRLDWLIEKGMLFAWPTQWTGGNYSSLRAIGTVNAEGVESDDVRKVIDHLAAPKAGAGESK